MITRIRRAYRRCYAGFIDRRIAKWEELRGRALENMESLLVAIKRSRDLESIQDYLRMVQCVVESDEQITWLRSIRPKVETEP